DNMTVWLARGEYANHLAYYFLDTKLPPAYEDMVANLLQSAALADKYVAKTRMGRVAIMGTGGEPFGSLPDVEFALTVVSQAMTGHLTDISIESVRVTPEKYETQTLDIERFKNLIQTTPSLTLADHSVLLIESNPGAHTGIEGALDALGVEVRQAQSGATALEILMDEEPDLVIIDLMLPDLHGYEVIARIRKDPLTANTPIIAMSSYNSEADVVFALNVAQVDDFMLKPIDPNVLRHRVIHLLNRRV
ncbi:MAG: PleD family two-component system response regulator, partial [Anaerolineales bacterium]